MTYYDLGVWNAGALEASVGRGWSPVCLLHRYSNNPELREFSEKNRNVMIGAVVGSDVKKSARNALEHADIILVESDEENVLREAAECHEVDVILHPKKFQSYQRDCIDYVMAKFMAERGIALGVVLTDILGLYGRALAQYLGMLRRSLLVTGKYEVPIAFVSGARDKYDVRAPLDVVSFLQVIGAGEKAAKDSLTSAPRAIAKRAADRKDPNVILKGLEVLRWGSASRGPKKMWGWY